MAQRLTKNRLADRLFDGWQETLIWSALEGEMGRIWALDTGEPPKAALCENGDFLFLAGAPSEPQTRALLEGWRAERNGQFVILAPRDPACGPLIEAVFGGAARRAERYAFCKGGEAFDPERLKALASAAPVALVPLDAALYEQALQSEWSRDFVSQFQSAAHFLQRGLGVAALDEKGEFVGGASSYIRYSRGIEIQVQTREDRLRLGIATACSAQLILDCLNGGLYPSWDAANAISVRLAQKLGYRLAGAYPVWELR